MITKKKLEDLTDYSLKELITDANDILETRREERENILKIDVIYVDNGCEGYYFNPENFVELLKNSKPDYLSWLYDDILQFGCELRLCNMEASDLKRRDGVFGFTQEEIDSWPDDEDWN